MVSIPGAENVNWFAFIGDFMYWGGIILGCIIAFGVLFAIYYYFQFTIKVTVFQMFGSGKDGVFSFGKPKTNRVKWINKRSAWKSLFPLFNKKEREPFDSEYIYPGNKIFVFQLGEDWIPGRINIEQTEDEIRTEINPVPYYIRNWQSLEHKKNAQEFAMHSFWEDNKYFIMGVLTVLICCICCGVTIYMSYKFATQGVQSSAALAEALKNFGAAQAT